ncbi:MAG: glycosyltransferase family 39 protein [Bryobacteraceae bacterium]
MEITDQEEHLLKTNSSDTVTGSKTRVFCLAFFFVVIACSYLPWCLHDYRSFKVEDSGLFLHMGQRLLHGDVLYRDIADNKPPLVYWLNALGLLLGHGSPGGVLSLCLAAGILTFAILYWGLRQYVGWQLFIVAGCWSQLAFLVCAAHPNYTESFALPLVALAAVFFARDLLNAKQLARHALAQGAIATLLFCLRPNNIGISIIYFLYLLLGARRGDRIRQLCYFAFAAAAVYAVVLAPLAMQGVLPDYFTYVFRLAAPYTGGTTLTARVGAFWHGLILFASSPLLYFSLACGATVILSQRPSRHTRVVFWVVAWLALEMIMSSTSGYYWNHYYLLWISPLALLTMLAGSVLCERGLNPILPVALAVSLTLVLLIQTAIAGHVAWSYPRTVDPAVALARSYVRRGDRVTTWGYFYHDLWFDLDQRPGTRWFHEGAYTNRKIYQALMPMFLSDMEQNRPRIVIEHRSVLPLFAPAKPNEPLNDAFKPEYFEGWDDPGILKRKAALAQQYSPVMEKSGDVVYVRRLD